MAVDTRLSGTRGRKAPSVKADGAAASVDNSRPRSKSGFEDLFVRLAKQRTASPASVAAVVDKSTTTAVDLRLAESRHAAAENPGAETQETNPGNLLVWAKENRLTSQGKVAQVSLQRTVRLSVDGLKIELVHVSGSSVLKTVKDQQPFAPGENKVTQDGFDQVQALHTADTFLRRLAGYGIDLPSVYRDSTSNSGLVRIIANAMSEENAGYIPGSNVYVFGTSEGRFHLVSCKEILVHELAHGYFDHVAPGVNSDTTGEGKPFHEAVGDLFAALHFENPNISEDLGAYLAEKEGTSGTLGPLRTLVNDVSLDPSLTQEHKRSLAYSGMVWSVTSRLANAIGMHQACDLMLGAIAKAPFFVTNKSPSPEDCLRAILEGVRSHIGKAAPKLVDGVIGDIEKEAIRRKITNQPLAAATPTDSAKLFETSLSAIKEQSASAFAGVARTLPSLANRGDIAFQVMGDRRFGDVRRVTLRALVQDPTSRNQVPVEDGHLEVVLDGKCVRYLEGPALCLPAKFDFTTRDGGNPGKTLTRAKRLIADHLTQLAEHDPSAATVRRGLDTLFDDANLVVRPILSEGSLQLEVITLAGEFIVDIEHSVVRTRRLMHVYDIAEHAHG